MDRQDAMRSVKLWVVLIRYDREQLLQNRARGGGILRQLVEEANAFLMFECREESEEALKVLRIYLLEGKSWCLLGCAFFGGGVTLMMNRGLLSMVCFLP